MPFIMLRTNHNVSRPNLVCSVCVCVCVCVCVKENKTTKSSHPIKSVLQSPKWLLEQS